MRTVFEPYPEPKNNPLGPKKVKKTTPKLNQIQNSKVNIKRIIENESLSTT